ncbi:hypothetical protein [Limnoglobus roseus]|uniref:Uncharacterized protein n=1 Tax=Limnoglobus roseus TaxID=2598579 RepID=A0A5C1AIM2_9BACT|nr:hypothetical protein [Limnoglobus roseus]QEL18700.1 hypothetical protein PX52LOC_05736 [Limnoglobus roseus]
MTEDQTTETVAAQPADAPVESTFDPEHPVRKPPFAFSEGEEVILPDGVKGKVVGITKDEAGEASYSVVALAVREFSEAQLLKA